MWGTPCNVDLCLPRHLVTVKVCYGSSQVQESVLCYLGEAARVLVSREGGPDCVEVGRGGACGRAVIGNEMEQHTISHVVVAVLPILRIYI